MVSVEKSELENNYVMWLATGIAFYRNVTEESEQEKIKELVISSGGGESLSIPSSLASQTKNIKIFARHLRLSKWCFDHSDELKEVAELYADYTLEDFVNHYNKWIKEQ